MPSVLSIITMMITVAAMRSTDTAETGNQRGEIEYEDHGLSFDQVEVEQILVSMEDK